LPTAFVSRRHKTYTPLWRVIVAYQVEEVVEHKLALEDIRVLEVGDGCFQPQRVNHIHTVTMYRQKSHPISSM
jgi:hypothetical protein